MNIEDIKAAMEWIDFFQYKQNTVEVDERANTSLKTIRTLLDQAINAPDLDATIAQCIEHAKRDWKEGAFGYNEAEIVVDTVRLLAPLFINAPLPPITDLESLKREVTDAVYGENDEFLGKLSPAEVISKAIDHLASRIVREGMVVVPVETVKEINRLSKMYTSREYKESENYNIDEEDMGDTFIDAYDMFVSDVRLLNKKVITASKGD